MVFSDTKDTSLKFSPIINTTNPLASSCHMANNMTLNCGGEWDTMGANAWWIPIIA
jgi:hypothetical protein